MSTDDTTLARVREFMSRYPGGCSSEFAAGCLNLPIGEVLAARLALAKSAAKAKAQSEAGKAAD